MIYLIQAFVDEQQSTKEKKKKKKKKHKKHKKETQEEEKINNMDVQNNAKPESEAQKSIPDNAWASPPPPPTTRNLSPQLSSQEVPYKSPYLQRRLTPLKVQNDMSEDSDDVEDNAHVKTQEPYNILSTPRRSRSKLEASDSDSDVPRKFRKKKSLTRVESSTEDERRSKSKFFKRFKSRQLSDTD